MITTLILDFAGVVSSDQFRGARRIAERFNLDPEKTKKLYYANIEELGRGGKGSMEKFWRAVCPPGSASLMELEEVFRGWWLINEEVSDLIRKLRKGYKVVLLSDNFDATSPFMRTDERISSLYDKMYFSNEIGHTKKEKESFQFVLKDLGVTAQECFFTDDKEGPVNTAKSLGISALLFTSADNLEKDLVKLGIL